MAQLPPCGETRPRLRLEHPPRKPSGSRARGPMAQPAALFADPPARDWLDRLLALLIMALLAPLALAIAAAIALDSPGPVLFRQCRDGLRGSRFTILKFRTMHWRKPGQPIGQTLRHDARITRVGRFLRASSLDELPQLWNVLRGEMALVGPRPHAHELHQGMSKLLAGAIYTARLAVKPGMTGWAQIKGARGAIETEAQFTERMWLDLYYVAHRSLWLDLRILLATPLAVLRAENAF